MAENQEISLTQMRKSVQKLGFSTEKFEDPTLMRFLIARSMDSEKAAKMFVQWRKWRASMAPLGSIPENEVLDELAAKKIYLQGLSKDGYPVMIVKAHRHFPSKDQPQFKRFVVHLLDKTIASSFKERELGNEKLIGVLDLQQLAYKNIDHRGLIIGFQFLQAYYPERLAKCFILNMPRFFVSIWKMVSHFLEKATLEKVLRTMIRGCTRGCFAVPARTSQLIHAISRLIMNSQLMTVFFVFWLVKLWGLTITLDYYQDKVKQRILH